METNEELFESIRELLSAIYITDRRIYDVMARLLANLDDEEAQTLMQIHSQGGFITPPPSYMIGPDDDDD